MTARIAAAEMHEPYPKMWRALEVAAFDLHTDVLVQLDPDGPRSAQERRGARVWLIPLMIVMFALYGAPIWGFAALAGSRFGETVRGPEERIPTAGLFFVVALVVGVVHVVVWLRRGRKRDGLSEMFAGVALVLGALSSGVVAVAGSRAEVPGWEWWALVMLVYALGGAAFSLVLRLSRRGEPARVRQAPGQPLARVRTQVARLSDEARDDVRRDLDAALLDLSRRGVIDAAAAERARTAELGMLALHMSQGRGEGRSAS